MEVMQIMTRSDWIQHDNIILQRILSVQKEFRNQKVNWSGQTAVDIIILRIHGSDANYDLSHQELTLLYIVHFHVKSIRLIRCQVLCTISKQSLLNSTPANPPLELVHINNTPLNTPAIYIGQPRVRNHEQSAICSWDDRRFQQSDVHYCSPVLETPQFLPLPQGWWSWSSDDCEVTQPSIIFDNRYHRLGGGSWQEVTSRMTLSIEVGRILIISWAPATCHELGTNQRPGRFLDTISRDPSVSKTDRPVTCWCRLVFFFVLSVIKLKNIR